MTTRPIIFSAPMIRALVAGNKTMTRRIVKKQPVDQGRIRHLSGEWFSRQTTGDGLWEDLKCPFGTPGDQLWVKETFSHQVGADAYKTPSYCDYFAEDRPERDSICWTPSIFMPRWASRITLEITAVRVERLQEISEADAKAEGVEFQPSSVPSLTPGKGAYRQLWESIHGPGSWALNPWVWVISFRRIEQ